MSRRFCMVLLTGLFSVVVWAQGVDALSQLKADPRKSYGNDYPYPLKKVELTKAPKGYTPFYISHYARHGSRYYWTDKLYKELDTMLVKAHEKKLLTAEGEAFREKYMAVKQVLQASVGELSQLGWEQHQGIARIMYENYPEIFGKGGNVYAISSLAGRCVMSMAAFCLEMTQCNPNIDIREQSSRLTLDGVVPTDRQNPFLRKFPHQRPRYEKNRSQFHSEEPLRQKIVARLFINPDSMPGNKHHIGSNLINFYTSLPSIGYEGMMEGLLTDEEIATEWEASNLGSYSWVFFPQYEMIPILEDIMKKADTVISGSSDRIADLRFGHDTCLGPLTVLMGINGADRDPEDPYEVKNCYQNWETCKAGNIQLVFYRGKKGTDDILVKCLLNGDEATLPVPTTQYPYYRWSDFRDFYTQRIQNALNLSQH